MAYQIGYTWNQAAGRFIAPSGRFLSFAEVRAALDRAIVGAATEASGLAELLQSGTIGVLEFVQQMRILIKDSQIYSTAVAVGGYGNIDPASLESLQESIGTQFSFLADWAADLQDAIDETGEVIEAGKQLQARAAMYLNAARAIFASTYRSGMHKRGFNEEINVLGHAEHCDQCVEMTQLGWVPMFTLIPIGQRTCIVNCKCRLDYRIHFNDQVEPRTSLEYVPTFPANVLG